MPRLKDYLGLVFWLVMALLLMAGLGGLYVSATWKSESQIQLMDDTISDVSSVFPRLSYEQSQKIRQTLTKWEERTREEGFSQILLRDGAIALIIAVLLTVTIELYAGRRLRAQVAEDVLSGVFNKIIPETIFEQVKSYVIQAPVLRRNWEIRMTLARDTALEAIDPNLYVSTTIIEYGIENLLGRQQTYTIISGLAADVTGADAQGFPLPRFVRVTAQGRAYEGANLDRFLRDGKLQLTLPVDLPARTEELAQILIELKEIVRVPDTFNWASPMPADGATIEIDTTGTQGLAFKVEAYHPNQDGLRETIAGRRWAFSRGILPWQGFEIRVHKNA